MTSTDSPIIGRIHSLESMGTVDGPGIRFVTFLQGCPMRCKFCHNPDTWEIGAKTKYELTPEELIREVRKYKNFIKSGGVTCTGGEPLLQAGVCRSLLQPLPCRRHPHGARHRRFCGGQKPLDVPQLQPTSFSMT